MLIVKPTIIPTIIPIMQLEKTNVNASYIYNLTIWLRVKPIALSTAISLLYSIMFAVMEDIKLKKHRIITIAVSTEKIMSVSC